LDVERAALLTTLAELQRQQIAADKTTLLDVREQLVRARAELEAETLAFKEVVSRRERARAEWADMQIRMADWEKTKIAVEKDWLEREAKRRLEESQRRITEQLLKAERSSLLQQQLKQIEEKARGEEEDATILLRDLEGEEAELRAQERIQAQVQGNNVHYCDCFHSH
jgi:hypothetical protein